MFSKQEINTGRQIEFDYMKGFFTPMILLIHAFQLLGGMAPAYQVFYIMATMTGSAIFMFVLGMGSTYSRRTDKQLALSGVKLVWYELLWNALSLCLPMVLGQLIRSVLGLEPAWDIVRTNLPIMLEYINVFFVAGVSYLMLALLRYLRTPVWMYFALTVLFMFINPLLYMNGVTTGNGFLDYVLTMFAGGRPAITLCFLTHIPYVLLGVGFGRILRRTTDKSALYKAISVPAAIIVIAYFAYALSINDGLDALYTYSDNGYTYPGTLRAFANCSSVLLMAAVLYALRNRIGAIKPLHNVLMHFNRQTTPYYAVHPFFYSLISALAAYKIFSAAACVALTPVVGALCFITIVTWNRLRAGGR